MTLTMEKTMQMHRVTAAQIRPTLVTGCLNRPQWTPIQTFPAADGSRTLRVTIPNEVIDALFLLNCSGVRHTVYRNKTRKFLGRCEVRDAMTGTWLDVNIWKERALRYQEFRTKRVPQAVSPHAFYELSKGNIVGINQTAINDPDAPAGTPQLKSVVEVDMTDGSTITLNEWLKRETHVVEMCLPLSRDEADAFFTNELIMGVRHSWLVDTDTDTDKGSHLVEVTSAGEVWSVLPPSTVVAWDSIVEPHFRVTYENKLTLSKARRVYHVPTPWIQS